MKVKGILHRDWEGGKQRDESEMGRGEGR